MGAAWTRAVRDLRPDAQLLVRALAVLDGPSISLVSVAAVLEMPRSRVAAVVSELVTAGWGSLTEDRFEIAAGGQERLSEMVQLVLPGDVDEVLVRVAAVVEVHVSGMPPAVRTDVVSVVRAAGRHRRVDVVSAVARAG